MCNGCASLKYHAINWHGRKCPCVCHCSSDVHDHNGNGDTRWISSVALRTEIQRNRCKRVTAR